MTGLLQRSRNCRVVLAKRWVVGSFLTTNIHRRFSLRFECLSLSLRTTTGTRMTSSTLVQAQRDAALNPVSRFNTEIVFSFDNLSFWRSVSLKITSSTRTSGLKKLQRRSHHSSSVSWYPGDTWSDHAAWAKGDLPSECQQCQQLRHLQVRQGLVKMLDWKARL